MYYIYSLRPLYNPHSGAANNTYTGSKCNTYCVISMELRYFKCKQSSPITICYTFLYNIEYIYIYIYIYIYTRVGGQRCP